jgi:beta-galactosidase GanA
MDLFSFTPQYLTKNNRPWFPMMGEIHYSRYPAPFWKEAVLKMKAGGIDIISSYVIWIHHEEIEGEYDFSGSKNLRAFIETVQDCGLYFLLESGPGATAKLGMVVSLTGCLLNPSR